MYKEFDKKVEAALKGDRLSKEWLINSLKPLITSYSKRYGGQIGWNEELYQEGALQVLEALNAFDMSKGVPFLGFITIRLKHYYQNKRRKEKTTISLDQPVGEEENMTLLDLLVDESIAIEEDYIKTEEESRLLLALYDLDENDRYIIREYYIKGRSLKEIAKEKNLHYVTVAKHKAKALQKLKNFLEKVG